MPAPRITLRQLDIFVAVAASGSMSAAAETLRLTPAAVATAMTALERTMRTQLLVRRRSKGVSLTPSGSFLLPRARGLLAEANELESAVGSGGTRLTGPIALGCYATMAPRFVPPLLDAFERDHPAVTITVTTGAQDQLPGRLLAGELDVALLYDTDLPPSLARRVVATTPAYVLLPAGHRLTRAARVRLADLTDETLVLLDSPPSGADTRRRFDEAGIAPAREVRVGDFELARALVGRGVGCAVLVQRPAADVTYEGRPVVARPLDDDAGQTRVVIAWPRAIRPTDRTHALIEAAPQLLGGTQG